MEEEEEEIDSDSLSSSSDDIGDSDSLSSLDMSEEDRMSCLSGDTDSMSSFVTLDSDDSETAYPMSPEIKVTSPNHLQVPIFRPGKSGRVRKAIKSTRGSQDLVTTPPPTSSFTKFTMSPTRDSNAAFTQDQASVSILPTLNEQGLLHTEWSHMPVLGEDFEPVPIIRSGVQIHEPPQGDSESGCPGDDQMGADGTTRVKLQQWIREKSLFYNKRFSCTYLVNPQGEH